MTTCTMVCGNGFSSRSCSKICLNNVYPEGQPEKAMQTYARSVSSQSTTLEPALMFQVLCAEKAARLVGNSIDWKTRLVLPLLIECIEIPNNRSEIPTPDVALYHTQTTCQQNSRTRSKCSNLMLLASHAL